MVHQQLLCAKHLRHFGQYGSTAVSNHVVRETPQHRVSSNTRKTVRTTALQTKLQFAEFARLAFIVAHHAIQLMQMRDPGLDFIILLLADHEMNAFRIDIAQRFTECGNPGYFRNPDQSPALRPRSGGAPCFAAWCGY